MPSFFSLAQRLDGLVPRRVIAAAANMMTAVRPGDERHFSVLSNSLWVNRQPKATFVSPDIYTAHFEQVDETARAYWCQDYLPQAGDTVIDVGAGIGEEAVVFSEMVGPSGRVISIEAHPRTFACLRETVSRSGMGNVTPVHCAIAGEDGSVSITDSDQHLGNSVLEAEAGIAVQARTLDGLLAELGVERVDLLKMNIEGAEREAMAGMKKTAELTRHVAISCHDFVAESGGGEFFRSRTAVEAALVGFGFKLSSRPDASHPWLRDTLYGRKDQSP